MKNLKSLYQVPVGFSDHTTDLLASKTAISLGANRIERHFTLDKRMEGPDHLVSSDKEEMANLVKFKKNYCKFEKWYKNLSINEKKTIMISLITKSDN